MRFYFSGYTGTGIGDDFFYAAIYTHVPTSAGHYDGRLYPELNEGWALVWGEYTDEQHAAIVADPLVTYIPLDAGGVPADPETRLMDLDDQAAVITLLESHGIDATGLVNPKTVRDVVKRIWLNTVVRHLSTYLFEEVDSANVLSPRQLAAQRKRYEMGGFDSSVVAGNESLRGVLMKLSAQNRQTPFDL